jgi:tetratricopeptide (TPR) repeat protein
MSKNHTLRCSAVFLNNQGVAYLEERKIEKSLGCFQEALSLCQDPLQENDKLRAESHSEPSLARQDLSAVIKPRDLRPDYFSKKVGEGGFVYSKALAIDGRLIRPHIDIFSLLSYVAIFNLALCHHTKGVTTSSESTLRTAFRLYELAHRSMVRGGNEDILLFLAVANNLSRVLMRLGEHDRATLCSKQVLAMLMYITHEGKSVDQKLCKKFFSNVSHLILRCIQTAAAA